MLQNNKIIVVHGRLSIYKQKAFLSTAISLMERSAKVMHLGLCVCVCPYMYVPQKIIALIDLICFTQEV